MPFNLVCIRRKMIICLHVGKHSKETFVTTFVTGVRFATPLHVLETDSCTGALLLGQDSRNRAIVDKSFPNKLVNGVLLN